MTGPELDGLIDEVSDDAAKLVRAARAHVRRTFSDDDRCGLVLHKLSVRAALAEYCLNNFRSPEVFETLAALLEVDFD